MAQVNDSEGIPSVAPSATAPDVFQRIDANPSAFGADTARAAQSFGQQVAKAANDVDTYFGKVQVDDSLNGAFDEASAVLHGTGKKDPVTGQIDGGFMGTSGRNTLEAVEPTNKRLDEIFQKRRMTLKNPLQQREFDNAVRSYKDRYVSALVGNHAQREAKVYATNTAKASMSSAQRHIALNVDDDDAVASGMHDARDAAVKLVDLEGGSDDQRLEAIAAADAASIKTWSESIAVKNPKKALDIVERNKPALGVHYDELANKFRARATEQDALGIANDAFGATAQVIQNPVQGNAAAVREAILQQESGNKDAVATSVNGAVGPGQVMPNTFAAYAKPGEDIKNPVDNRVVSARIIDDLSKKFDGDPARIAVGYFSGPGNVAPAGSPTPWLRDVADGNGKTVSSYVSDVTQRMGKQGALLGARASVYDKVLASTEGNPVLRQAALREVDQRYRAAEISDLNDQKARKAQSDATLRGYGDVIRSGKGSTMPWRQDQSLTEEQVEHLDKLAIEYGKEAVNGTPGDYGPKYSEVLQRIYATGPNRIVNQEQLDAMAARGEINPAGHKAATANLAEMNKANSESNRVLESNFWNSARRAVTLDIGEQESDSTATPERRKKWDAAIPVMTQALHDGRAKGLTNQQLMDPTNKDSVWTALKPFLPTENEKLRADMAADAKAAKAPKLADLDTYEKALDAYNKGQIKRDQFKEMFKKNKWREKIGPMGNLPEVPNKEPMPFEGMVENGNVDLHKRPIIQNPDGSYSTVNTKTFGIEGGRYINIPGVDDKRQLSDDEALAQYKSSGKHLGIFKDLKSATAAAKQMHEDQDREYSGRAAAAPAADAEPRKAGDAMGEWDQKFVDHLNAEPGKARNLSYAMDYFAKNASDESQRVVADAVSKKLKQAGDDKFKFIPQSNVADYGVTTVQDGKIVVGLNANEGLNEETAVHEGLHAIVRHFAEGFRHAAWKADRGEALADLAAPEREAATKLLAVFDRMKGQKYEGPRDGKGDVPAWFAESQGKPSEFLSYALTSPDLQAWMRQQPDGASASRSMWDKFVDGVKDLVFGENASAKKRSMLEDAMDAGLGFVNAME